MPNPVLTLKSSGSEPEGTSGSVKQEKTNICSGISIQEVFDSHSERLRLVEARMKELFINRVPFIPLIGEYIVASGGKRLRPLFHILSSELSGFSGDKSIEIACIIESIHTASLLHDDVVDMAEVRRGKPSANSVWGNQIVVLVGDFLYSNALRAAVMLKNQKIMEALSNATTRMTEGELLQLNKIGDPELTEEDYLRIISAKTGGLISAACRIGAILGGRSDAEEAALAEFGMKTGMVFQMADDILDYMADEGDLGKKLCKDLEEGKITLPLLVLLSSADDNNRAEVKQIIKDFSEPGAERILELLRKYRAIEASMARARALIDDAKNALSVFPESRARSMLVSIADYSLEREK